MENTPKKSPLCLFTDHPREAGESYFQHLLFTLGMAGRLLVCSFVLIVHGIFPFLFCHTASRKMQECHNKITARAKDKPE